VLSRVIGLTRAIACYRFKTVLSRTRAIERDVASLNAQIAIKEVRWNSSSFLLISPSKITFF
jgi:hypothetical protein